MGKLESDSTGEALPGKLGVEGGDMERIKIEQHSFAGTLWFAAWLFTLGLLHLPFWKGVLALLLWPYYLGVVGSSLLPH
jgi:hypothetical protein